MRAIAIASLILLAGCGDSGAPVSGENIALDPQLLQQKPTATSIAGVDFGKRVEAFGTEPYWLLALEPGKIEFEDFGIKDGVKSEWPAQAPTITGNVATIETRTATGEAVTITLAGESCLEVGEEDNTLPLKATVKIGARTLTGCAGQKLGGAAAADSDNAISSSADNAGI
ncbi:MAG: hypothetical protein EOP62_08920 [Sphingomonadales bacterium]|nr:MAG: hypothetical protein EOP62_08920 [Sphingomonadales bacterium]